MATTKAFEIGDFGATLVVTSTGEVQSLDITTNEVAEHVNFRYFTESRARAALSVSGNLTYNSETGEFGFVMPTTIASLSNHDTDDLSEGIGNLYFTSGRARASLTGGTGITYSSSTGSIELTASGVTAGSYGSASQVPQITVDTYGRITSLTTTSVAGVTDFDYNTSTGVLDIDTADGGNFATTVTLAPFDTGDLVEGTRLYYTDARARAAVSATGSLSYNSSTGVFSFTQGNTDTVAEGSSNLYFTNARANAAITKATIDALNVDADTLDGLNSSQFLRSDANDTSSGTIAFGAGLLDPDSYGSYSGGFGNIQDGSGWGARGVFVHGGSAGDTAAMAHNGAGLYFGIGDSASSNSMSTWLSVSPNKQISFTGSSLTYNSNDIWHAGNDGAGSGLNADLVDGLHASQFLRSDTSDSMSGTLTVISALDAPIVTQSTDPTTGITFTDSGGTGYLHYVGTSDYFYTQSNLHVGGSSSPSEKLDVNGNIRVPNLPAGGGITFHSNREMHIVGTDDGSYSHDKGLILSTLDYNSYGISMGIHTGGGLTSNLSNFTPQLRIDNNGNVGIGTESPQTALEVDGVISSRTNGSSGAFNIGLLEIVSNGTPSQVKITTNIPYSGGATNAHTVRISGFRYGEAETADILISWHVYLNQFWNRTASSSGGWAPDITLGVENNKVVIHLSSPGYWPKLVVESLYNAFGGADHADGWSWTEAPISSDANTPNQTVSYKQNFGNNFVMKADGKVGIGTTSPNRKLEVVSDIDGSPLRIQGNSSVTQMEFAVSGGSVEAGIASSANELAFRVGSSSSSAEKMRMTTSGNYHFNSTGSHGPGGMVNITNGGTNNISSNALNVRSDTTNYALTLTNTVNGDCIWFSDNGNNGRGSIKVTSSGTTYNTTSDRRLKDNITTITDGKEKLLAMNPVTHSWKANPEAPQVHGFIAQEMQEVVPEAVSGDAESDEMMSMDYGRITPVIVAALQDALKEIEELKTRIKTLEAK